MKHIYTSIIVFVLLGGLSACQSNSTRLSAAEESAIRESSKDWVETYNQNDWKKLATLFSPDAIMMPPNSPVVEGRVAIAAWEAENETGFRIAFDIEEIEGSGDLAYVRGKSCLFIPDGNGGYGVDVGKFLEIRKKQADGAWLITADIFNSDAAIGNDLRTYCPFSNLP